VPLNSSKLAGVDEGKSGSKQKAGQIGGARRAELLPANRRAEIARKAAAARWGVKASHRGNFQEQLGIDVECYVLEDDNKTAVISQTGMARALGLSSRGNALSISRQPSDVWRGRR
jgi:hypothetical protein